MLRRSNILHTMLVPNRIASTKVERTHIYGFVSPANSPMKGNPDKTSLEHITTPNVYFKNSFRKVSPVDPDYPRSRFFVDMHAIVKMYGITLEFLYIAIE